MTEPDNVVSFNGTDYRRPPNSVKFVVGHEVTNEERWGFAITRRDELLTAVNAAIQERHTHRIEQGNVDNDNNPVTVLITRDKWNKNDIAHCKQDFDRFLGFPLGTKKFSSFSSKSSLHSVRSSGGLLTSASKSVNWRSMCPSHGENW